MDDNGFWPTNFWTGKRVLVTGHTGFKGTWLTLWLGALGARVSGFALPPAHAHDLWNSVAPTLEWQRLHDLRDDAAVAAFMGEAAPEIVIHMAAQALVRRSFEAPVETFAVNVLGTAHVLEAVRRTPSVRSVIVVTTDKVYENVASNRRAFLETDPLGGHDPYSASKACAELLVASYVRSFFAAGRRVKIATARAGNVIGGGDWSDDRIIPDIVRAAKAGQAVRLRYPGAVRPWQHVLEPLAGYLMLAEAMETRPDFSVDALNFGPDADSFKTVAELVDAFTVAFGRGQGWLPAVGEQPHEAGVLTLSAARAHAAIGWRPLMDFHETVAWTADWYRRVGKGSAARDQTMAQIADYGQKLRSQGRVRSSPVVGEAT